MQTVEFEYDNEIIEKVIEFFPKSLILDVAREKPAELIQAICKVCSYGFDSYRKAHLVEEMADTLVVIRELQKLFAIPDEDLQEFITSKQMRTRERISELERRLERLEAEGEE